MARKKVETAKKAVAVEEVKVNEVKAEEVKAEPAKAVVEAPVKEAAPKKTSVKEAAPKKAPAKKTTVKKTSEEKTCNFYIQYAGKQFSYEEIIEKSKEVAAVEMGKKVSSVKKIDIYCKPEEQAAYYVANGKVAGRIDL